jgi:nitroimidazol reductase NimA-like FMN-containing flavoprotein (pyridoxamine 5'-phosphate oxidase superfamily)
MTASAKLDQAALNIPRRRDRTVHDETWIKQFLMTAPVGTLATVEGDQPFVNTNLFVYDDLRDCIYMHTAQHGRTRTNLETPEASKICFTSMEIGRLLAAPTAFNFSVEYAGVVVFGIGQVVEDSDEALNALNQLMLKYASHLEFDVDYGAPTVEELKRTTVYRIDITAWSGKKKEVAEDTPGAYWYSASPILPSVRARFDVETR